jgi:hypothetical protein
LERDVINIQENSFNFLPYILQHKMTINKIYLHFWYFLNDGDKIVIEKQNHIQVRCDSLTHAQMAKSSSAG